MKFFLLLSLLLSSFALGQQAPRSAFAVQQYVANGDFGVWQRGAGPFAGAATYKNYTADMFKLYDTDGNHSSVSRVAGTSTNMQYGLKLQRTASDTTTGAKFIETHIESAVARKLAGKVVTLSFYAKAGANYSPASSALALRLATGTGTDEDGISAWTGGAFQDSTKTLTTTITRFTQTYTLPASTTEIYLRWSMTPVGTAGADDSFTLEQVQLVEGPTVDGFRLAGITPAGELSYLQRFFERLYTAYGVGTMITTTENYVVVPFATKRVAPTLSFTAANTYALRCSAGALILSAISQDATYTSQILATVMTTTSGGTAGNACNLRNQTSSYIDVSAEL